MLLHLREKSRYTVKFGLKNIAFANIIAKLQVSLKVSLTRLKHDTIVWSI